MPVRETDRLRAPSRGSATEALLHIDGPDDNDKVFVAGLALACSTVSLDFAPVMAHVHLESAGLTSPRYRNDKNPSGLGIPADDTPQPFTIPDYITAARMHVSAMNRLVEGTRPEPWTLPANIQAWLSTVWRRHCDAAKGAGVAVRTVGDLNIRYPDAERGPNATWAWDAGQGAKIEERGRLLFPTLPDQQTGGTPTVALSIRQSFIPAGNDNRPETTLTNAPLYITVHETANTSPGADAEMHRKFTHNGGGTSGVSFHWAVDDHEAIQLLPLDEVGFHAGDGCNDRATDLGCFQSVAIETCVNSDANWNTTFDNLSTLIAAIITGDSRIDFAGRKGQFAADRIRQHNAWSGKNCPAIIRARGLWPTLLATVGQKVGGTVPPPPPTDALPYAELFGEATGPDGTIYRYDPSPSGTISKAWRETGASTNRYPPLVLVTTHNGKRLFQFADGTIRS
jgi:hypothetical protein